jgi:cyclophilin family peptidyl-prolyl cis-trans isomerase
MVGPTSNPVVVPRLIPGLIIKTNDPKKDSGVGGGSINDREEETLAQRNERKAEIIKLKREL